MVLGFVFIILVYSTKVGMKIRKAFRSAFEHQLEEVGSIHRCKLKGHTLFNLKSEYNLFNGYEKGTLEYQKSKI